MQKCNNELKVTAEASLLRIYFGELVEAELATKKKNKLVPISVICGQKNFAT